FIYKKSLLNLPFNIYSWPLHKIHTVENGMVGVG
ncbi:hypothetical protein EVA_14655, partial [gut metagenome]